MTHSELVRRIAVRSGYPERVVRHLMAALIDEVKAAIIGREEVTFRTLFRVISEDRLLSVQAPGQERKKVSRIILRIRPSVSFRKELNQWTSSQSS